MDGEALVITVIAIIVGIVILGLLFLLYLDARQFAAECITAGGYVAGEGVCVR